MRERAPGGHRDPQVGTLGIKQSRPGTQAALQTTTEQPPVAPALTPAPAAPHTWPDLCSTTAHCTGERLPAEGLEGSRSGDSEAAQREAQEGPWQQLPAEESHCPRADSSSTGHRAWGTGHGDYTHCCRASRCAPAQGTQGAAEERPWSPVSHACPRELWPGTLTGEFLCTPPALHQEDSFSMTGP